MTKKNLLAIISGALLTFIGILLETSMNVTFPTLSRQFKVSTGTVQWIASGYLLVVSLVVVCSAYIKSRFKEQAIFVTGAIAMIVGDLICATASQFAFLLIGRMIQAVGTGIALPLQFNIIIERAPLSKRGLYVGIGGLITAFAPTIGPTFGGLMSYYFSWRSIFWSVLPLMFIALILGWTTIEQKSPLEKLKFDWTRLLLFAVMLVSLTLGFNTVSAQGWLNPWLLIALIIFAVATWAFIVVSNKSQRMLIKIEVFKMPVFVYSLLAYACIQFANTGVNYLLPQFTQLVDQTTSLIGGLVLLPGSLVGAILSPFFGRMFDQLGAKRPLLLGNLIVTIALSLFAIFILKMSPWLIALVDVVLNIGGFMAFPQTLTYSINQLPEKYSADANAWFNTLQQFFGSLSTTITASFLAAGQGKTEAAQISSGTIYAFCFFLVLILLNFVFYNQSFKHALQKDQLEPVKD